MSFLGFFFFFLVAEISVHHLSDQLIPSYKNEHEKYLVQRRQMSLPRTTHLKVPIKSKFKFFGLSMNVTLPVIYKVVAPNQ